jgi:uncharacterized membrane protein YagU involved in acid resistance
MDLVQVWQVGLSWIFSIIWPITFYPQIQLRSLDWVGLIIYGHQPATLWELVDAQIVHLLFAALLGVIFVVLVSLLRAKNTLLLGWVFSASLWLVMYGVTLVLQLPGINTGLGANLFHLLLASIYGVVLAELLPGFDRRPEKNGGK